MKTDIQVNILVVEDNDSERESIVEALQASIQDVNLLAVSDGEQALDYLSSAAHGKTTPGTPPKLILLDLAMPGADGFSVLGQVRSIEPEQALTRTPVVIFTDSQASGDITESYRCGANSYIIKPLSFPDFRIIVESIGQYWMMHNTVGV